ncbi:hypothetical protein [Micromonospora sp. NPDC023956]
MITSSCQPSMTRYAKIRFAADRLLSGATGPRSALPRSPAYRT